MNKIIFTAEMAKAFEILSHDRNPLHVDPLYARRTQFGRPVLFGMAGVLFGLSCWAKGRKFRIGEIQAQFKKPLFVGEEYEWKLSEEDHRVSFKILSGRAVRLVCLWTWSDMVTPESEVKWPSFHPAAEPEHVNDPMAAARKLTSREFPYFLNQKHCASLREFGLSIAQMPLAQLNALLWSSFTVGMIVPGRQALFSDMAMQFTEDRGNFEPMRFREAEWDDRFHKFQLSGTGTGVKEFTISAFLRPDPVNQTLDDVKAVVGASSRFKGQAVFISGSARGFGSILAQAFALHGAKVVVNYKSGQTDAERICSEVSKAGGQAFALQGDVGNEADCARMKSEMEKRFGPLDILIHNASPPIFSSAFLDTSDADFLRFVDSTIRLSATSLRSFLPLLKPGGTMINVSTIYTQKPEKHFAHYIAAKTAVEALVRALAIEFDKNRFITVRPPRMKTDQTNVAYDPLPSTSPMAVAKRLFESLKDMPAAAGHCEINLPAENI